MEIKPLYSLKEVARMLGKSLRTIKRWVARGMLVTVQLGRRRWVPIAALRAQALVWESVLLAAKLNRAA